MPSPAILDPMKRTINRKLLKYAAGRSVFCIRCQCIMDWKRTSIVSLLHHGDPVKTFVLCTPCWLKQEETVRAQVQEKGAEYALDVVNKENL